ncbi:GIN domain-containing protein, partial [Acidobacteriota bacterium]
MDGISLIGATEAEITRLTTHSFDVDLEGAGRITASGWADHQDITLGGAAIYQAENLESRTVNASVSGPISRDSSVALLSQNDKR